MQKTRYSKLREELLVMAKQDQQMRRDASRNAARWDWSVDDRHMKRMRAIVRTYGWPTYRMVGRRVADAAWLLVQHADLAPKWQRDGLGLMRAAVADHQASPSLCAMLEDRVLVNGGKYQRYGSQWYRDRRGAFRPRPIHDRARLDERRIAVGLESFARYAARMEVVGRRSIRKGTIPVPPKHLRAAVQRSARALLGPRR